MSYKLKHLLSMQDLSKEDIFSFIELAKEFKALNRTSVKKQIRFAEKPSLTLFLKIPLEREFHLKSPQNGLERTL